MKIDANSDTDDDESNEHNDNHAHFGKDYLQSYYV